MITEQLPPALTTRPKLSRNHTTHKKLGAYQVFWFIVRLALLTHKGSSAAHSIFGSLNVLNVLSAHSNSHIAPDF